jgi:homoserine kinase type II
VPAPEAEVLRYPPRKRVRRGRSGSSLTLGRKRCEKRSMALLTTLDLSAAALLGRAYGIDVIGVDALSLGSVNSNFRLRAQSGAVYFGRIYEEQDERGAQNEARLLRGLAQAGVPTAVPATPAGGERALTHAGKPFALYPWLEGESLCHERLTPAHCRQLGVALAKVHTASPMLGPLPDGRFGAPQLVERLRAIQSRTSTFDADIAHLEQRLGHYVAARSNELPMGLVHGDLFRDNVLWQGGQLVALLDFESASRGAFVYDLMVCVLAWCYRASFDLERVRALVEGYQSVRALTASERAAAVGEGAIACVRFATTRITDFEMRAVPGQSPGRDYRRFLHRLAALEAGVLNGVLGAP